LRKGVQRPNSRIQLATVERGTTIRKGPRTPYVCDSAPRKEAHCTVLPSPIWSARMQFWSRSQVVSSQFSPSSW